MNIKPITLGTAKELIEEGKIFGLHYRRTPHQPWVPVQKGDVWGVHYYYGIELQGKQP